MNRTSQAIQLLENEYLGELMDNYKQIMFQRFCDSTSNRDVLSHIHATANAIDGFAVYMSNECRDMLEVDNAS